MTIYYLYLKTHNKTGLRYLGQTVRNPITYKGSGIGWSEQLTLFGKSIRTEILISTEDKQVLEYWSRFYSKIWNVVDAQDDFGNKIYANRIPETGASGGGHNAGKNNIDIYGQERAAKIAKASSDAQRGKKRGRWFNNGYISLIAVNCPLGFVKGRLQQKGTRTRQTIKFKKCCYCNVSIDSSNLVSHEKRCFGNPNRIPYADPTKERRGLSATLGISGSESVIPRQGPPTPNVTKLRS